MTRRGIALLLALAATPAQAQSLRGYDYTRPRGSEPDLRAIIEFAAGKLLLEPGSPEKLFTLALQYDAERFRPVGTYQAAAHTVRLGVESTGSGGIRVDRRSALAQTATVELSPAVPLALDISLGAAEAALELGGLRLKELALKSGASRATLSFSNPNPSSCGSASVQSGAGQVTVRGLGNSGCRTWSVDGGVGSVTLDLAGAWNADGLIRLNLAMGGVTLQAPKTLGIRVVMSGFLAAFEGSDFLKNGRTYTSEGYDRAQRKVEVEVSSALGGVRVDWK